MPSFGVFYAKTAFFALQKGLFRMLKRTLSHSETNPFALRKGLFRKPDNTLLVRYLV